MILIIIIQISFISIYLLSMEEANIDNTQKRSSTQGKRTHKRKLRKPRDHSWNLKEQVAYCDFLKKNSSLFKTAQTRKKHKVFKALAQIIGTRSSVQVKSHHQKLQEKYRTTYNIVFNVEILIKRQTMALQELNKPFEKPIQAGIMSLDSSLYSIEKEAAERLPYRFDEFLFEGISENYESISRCILFNESESLI